MAAPDVLVGNIKRSRVERLLADYGEARIGPGRHKLDWPIEYRNATKIVGAGSRNTVIEHGGDGPAIDCAGQESTDFPGGEIEGISIKGAQFYTQSVADSMGLRLGRESGTPTSAQVTFRDVYIKGFETGILSEASVIGRFQNVITQQCDVGFSTTENHRTIQNLFLGCRWEQCMLGMRLGNCEELLFSGCIWQYNYGRAIWIGQHANGLTCQGLKFEQPYFEGNCSTTDQSGAGAVLVDSAYTSTSRSIEFSNVLCSGNGSDYDFEFGSNEGVILTGWPYSVAPTVLSPSSGTPVRTWSPGRAAVTYFSVGSSGNGYGLVHDATDNDLTPDGYRGDTMVLDYSTGGTVTTIENFNVSEGMYLKVELHSTNITLQHGSGNKAMVLVGSTNWNPSYPATIVFRLNGSGEWIEVNRGWLGGGAGTGSPYP